MFLQDTTTDLTDVIPNMVEALPRLLTDLTAKYPSTHIGLAEVQDKPYYPLGDPAGMCYNLKAPLSDTSDNLIISYNALSTLSGSDIPEDQYQAIISTVLDGTAEWRMPYVPGTGATYESSSGGRFVVLITDARPHINGDMALYTAYDTVPQGLPANSGRKTTDDVNFECLHQEYPSPQQLKDALVVTETKLIILTPEDAALNAVWTWVNEALLEQPSQYYQIIQADSSDIYDAVMRALDGVSNLVPCPVTTTTTEPASGPECQGCPCLPNVTCHHCAPECEAAIVMRFAKEPKKMQVLVNNI